MHGYEVTTPSTDQLTLLSVADMKAQLEIPSTRTRWDGLLETYIKAAISMGEALMNRQILKAAVTLTTDTIDRYIQLPGGKVSGDVTMVYYDDNNAEQTLTEDTDFVVDKVRVPAVLHWLDDKKPSEVYNRPDAYVITYSAGWASGDVPADIINALKMTVGHFFANREEVVVGHVANQVPFAAKTVFENNRIPNA